MSEKVTELTESTFDELIKSSTEPVLVDFWAEWCGPCRAVAPILDEMATEYEGKLKIAKVDVDANQALSIRFGVQSIPTMLLFKDGEVDQKLVGARGKEQLIADLGL